MISIVNTTRIGMIYFYLTSMSTFTGDIISRLIRLKMYGNKVQANGFSIPNIELNLENRKIVFRNIIRFNSEGPNRSCKIIDDVIFG